jgi:hypothetical protein
MGNLISVLMLNCNDILLQVPVVMSLDGQHSVLEHTKQALSCLNKAQVILMN